MGTCNRTKAVTEECDGPSITAEQELLGVDQADRILQALEQREISVGNRKEGGQPIPSDELREQILALYDEFRPRLYRYMRSMHLGPDQAEEVIQETFMRFTTKLLEGSDIENAQGWIVRVAHNLALDLLKKERKIGIPSESIDLLI